MSSSCWRLRFGCIFVLVILLAGCSAFGGLGDNQSQDPSTVESPNELDNSSVDSTDSDELLPGLTNETVTNQGDLLETHADILWNESYVYTDERMELSENGTVIAGSMNNITSNSQQEVFAQFGGLEAWGAEGEVLTRYPGNESRDIDPMYERGVFDKYSFSGYEAMEVGLTEMENITVAINHSGDADRYILESTDPQSFRYENASLKIVLHETGYVEYYKFEYDRPGVDGPETTITEITVKRVGDSTITVDPPEWLPDAREYIEDRDNTSADE